MRLASSGPRSPPRKRSVPESLTVTDHRDGATFDVYAQPRASRSEVVGVHDGALRVRITAAPVEGAANEAIVTLLSNHLGIRRTDIVIIGGAASRWKRVLVRSITADGLQQRLTGR